ncbi:hypothetical protein HRbin26_02331 [bacterium HR26]|nr:hypothetical protein HRbin26_02331 [bacterium HR26]
MDGEATALAGQHAGQGDEWTRQPELDRVVVDCNHLTQELADRDTEAANLGPALERGDYVGCAHLLAIVEADTPAQRNGRRQAIVADLVPGSEHGDGLVVAVEGEERLIHVPADQRDGPLRTDVHIQPGWLPGRGHPQTAAAAWLARGRGGLRRLRGCRGLLGSRRRRLRAGGRGCRAGSGRLSSAAGGSESGQGWGAKAEDRSPLEQSASVGPPGQHLCEQRVMICHRVPSSHADSFRFEPNAPVCRYDPEPASSPANLQPAGEDRGMRARHGASGEAHVPCIASPATSSRAAI